MRTLPFSGWISAVFLFLAAPALAGNLQLFAPASARQGTAVVVTAQVDIPLPAVSFAWQDKRISAPLLPAEDHWEAAILLPVPVNAGRSIHLHAVAESNVAEAVIHISPVAWPQRNIAVDTAYVFPPKAIQDRIAADSRKTTAALGHISPERFWQAPFQHPVPGMTVTSAFGCRRLFNGKVSSWHRGVDLRAPLGTPVLAMADGKVVLAENMYYSGKAVFIDHGLGAVSSYAHMSRIDVYPGERVTAGRQIGLSGATGRVTGPHLHLGMSVLGVPVDALSLFANQQ